MKKEKQNWENMELGNLIFGNSRGEYPLPRGEGFEEELFRLFDEYAPERDNSWREYGVEFENEVFSVFPYYWGDCTCGFDNYEFTEGHKEDCYQSELKREKLKNGWRQGEFFIESDMSYDEAQKKEREIIKRLYEKRGWDTKSKDWWHGCAVRCDCDYDERFENWLKEIGYPDGHKKECLLEKPNFLYKPTGFEIQWYKYPLRDSYTNQPITLKEFKEIIDSCIKSLKTNYEKRKPKK